MVFNHFKGEGNLSFFVFVGVKDERKLEKTLKIVGVWWPTGT